MFQCLRQVRPFAAGEVVHLAGAVGRGVAASWVGLNCDGAGPVYFHFHASQPLHNPYTAPALPYTAFTGAMWPTWLYSEGFIDWVPFQTIA